jgi:hypothetical protein
MAVADYGGNTSHSSQFVRSALRITARDHDSCIRIYAMSAPDKCTGGAVCLRRHAARIHDDHIGLRRMALGKSGRAQAATYRFAIGARRSASEVLDVKFRHIYSLLPSCCLRCRVFLGLTIARIPGR